MKREDQIRKEILFQLYALRPLALSPERIARDALKNGYDYTASEVRREMYFLLDEVLLVRENQSGTTELLARINNNGVRAYEERYAA